MVILLTLFWRKFHGRAAIITIISGILFTVFWISGGFEQHYKVTEQKIEFLINQGVIGNNDRNELLSLEGKRFINSSKLEAAVSAKLPEVSDGRNKLSVITSSFTEKGIPARLITFLVALAVAVFSTYLVPGKQKKEQNIL